MSAPAVIDSLEFARSGSPSRHRAVASLKRLDDLLFDVDGNLAMRRGGARDDRKRPQLELRSRPFAFAVPALPRIARLSRLQSRTSCAPCAEGAHAEDGVDDPTRPDAIEASAELDLRLIEDEFFSRCRSRRGTGMARCTSLDRHACA